MYMYPTNPNPQKTQGQWKNPRFLAETRCFPNQY